MHTRILQFFVLAVFFDSAPALGAPGDVDPTFVYPRPQALEPDSTNAIPLADGFLVVRSRDFDKAGVNSTLEVTRIDEDGRVIANFGSGGTVTITLPGAVNVATAVKGMPDGSMLLAGFQRVPGAVPDNVAAVVRLDATGRLDPTFGVGGMATFDVPGQVDRVGTIDTLADGRILAGVWSRMQADPYGDCSNDRVSLVRLNPNGTGAEVIYLRERNEFPDTGCRNVMSLQVLPDQRIYFGSQIETAVFDSPEPTGWRSVRPLRCCYGPFVFIEGLGVVWAFVDGSGLDWELLPAYRYDDNLGDNGRMLNEALKEMGFPARRMASQLVPDGDPPAWFMGFSSDGGVAGVAKVRSDGMLDTGWAGGLGVIRVDGSGRRNDYATEGLANDVRLISVRPGGETLVVVTADGIIERRFAQSGPAHGQIRFAASNNSIVRESAGAAQITVRRVGGAEGAVSVGYSVGGMLTDCQVDACARPGEDFMSSTGRLEWADGDAGDRTITVPVINDTVHEPTEHLYIELTEPTGGAVLTAEQKILEIDILDDDALVPAGSGSGKDGNTSGGSGGGGATDPPTMLMFVLMFAAGARRGNAWKVERPRTAVGLLALGSILLAGGCAPALEATNAAIPVGQSQDVAATIAADDAVVCKTSLETGSRVRKNKICMTKSEWTAHTEAARRYTNSIERSRSTQVGGDSMTPSTPTKPGG